MEFYTIKQNYLLVKYKNKNYIREQQLDLTETLDLLKSKNLEAEDYRVFINNNSVKVSSTRLKNMTCNINNLREGLIPLFFSMEQHKSALGFHLNLYGYNEICEVVMINQDDIIGRVKKC